MLFQFRDGTREFKCRLLSSRRGSGETCACATEVCDWLALCFRAKHRYGSGLVDPCGARRELEAEMRVFILGGTGSIGTAVVQELVARSHDVVALSRSEKSDEKLSLLGAAPCRGDLRAAEGWVDEALACDAVIQVAATFDEDMAVADNCVTSALISASSERGGTLRLIYTGGCWLYGETGDAIATEDRPFDPLRAFSWMVGHAERLLKCPTLSTAVVHPAMVYHEEGGAFERFLKAARENRPIEIRGGPDTRWPIIERTDLANAYCDLLMRPELKGHFNVSSEVGVRVGDIAKRFAGAYGSTGEVVVRCVEDVVRQHGSWAKGPTLDQQMSSGKLQNATGWKPKVIDYQRSAVFEH